MLLNKRCDIFRKADNFCQRIEQKNYGRLFPSLVFKPYTCPNQPGSTRSKDACLVPLSVFCEKKSCQFAHADKSKSKNDVISRRVRQFPFKIHSFFQNLLIYKIISIVSFLKFLLTCITFKSLGRHVKKCGPVY